MSRPCPAVVKRRITEFDKAAQDFAFLGAAHPDDREAIRRRYESSRVKLEQAVSKAVWP